MMENQGALELLYLPLAVITFLQRAWGSVRKRQSHLLERAKLVSFLLEIPSPPLSFGLVITNHLIKMVALDYFLLLQRKSLKCLSMSLYMDVGENRELIS